MHEAPVASFAMLDFGREIAGWLPAAERREWLCTNGIGGFASGTVAGLLRRRYHGLLVAALAPPLGRTVLVAKIDEVVDYAGAQVALGTNRWADGAVQPEGYRHIERFRLEGTAPVWTYAIGDALLEKRVWMEQGANTTHVGYRLVRATEPMRLDGRVLVNYRDYHAETRAGDWRMAVDAIPGGLAITAFDGAHPVYALAPSAEWSASHDWWLGFDLACERERGLGALDDNLAAGRFRIALPPGGEVTITLSAEPRPGLVGQEGAWARRRSHDAGLLDTWRRARPEAAGAPPWIDRLVLAADQFVVARPLPDHPGGTSIIAGYPWFGDWGRDTMIALPGLLLATGRHEAAGRILRTFARFVDHGMLPNRFPDAGEAPEYNTADATLWYFEAVRAYVEASDDGTTLAALFPVLADVVGWHRRGTRYGIGVDPADGLLRAGEPGVQLTWMDAKVGDWVVTPRIGKPVEINALWYNALCAMAGFARRLGKAPDEWEELAGRAAAGFERFWSEAAGYCRDVVDGPDGADDDSLRPNQILAVSLAHTPLSPERQRGVVDACARHLLTSFGLRSLAPGQRAYQGRYGGGSPERDGAYHQGAVWAWLLGPFALAHYRVHGDREAALGFLAPIAHHLDDHGLGSVAEIFDGDPPFSPNGCPAQAWSVAEVLRAWTAIRSAGA